MVLMVKGGAFKWLKGNYFLAPFLFFLILKFFVDSRLMGGLPSQRKFSY
jgi:hypothetical protein